MSVKILLMSKDPVTLAGLQAIVGGTEALSLINGTAVNCSGPPTVERAAPQPDVVILGEPHSKKYVSEIIQKFTANCQNGTPRPKFIVVSQNDDDDAIVAAVRAGASGYLSQVGSPDELLHAIQIAAQGGAVFSSKVAIRLSRYFSAMHNLQQGAKFPDLTSREIEILELLADGLENRQIAKQLFLSEKTIRNYVSRIFTKLEVTDRTMAAVRARDAGLGHEDLGR